MTIHSYLINEKGMTPERLVQGEAVEGKWEKETIQCEFNLIVNGETVIKKS